MVLTMTDRVGNVSTATVTVTLPTADTWTETISTDWTDCRNWTYGKVPDATTSAAIPTGMTFYPNLTTGTPSGESETSYIIGNVEVTHNLATTGTADNFGSLGLTLMPNSSIALPGSTLVRRYFVIIPTLNTGLNMAMDFAYFNHELNGIPTANLAICSRPRPARPARGRFNAILR